MRTVLEPLGETRIRCRVVAEGAIREGDVVLLESIDSRFFDAIWWGRIVSYMR